jgi:starch synthase (maltosyl-transferring)
MAPKIYHLHPLVAGRLSEWPGHFARCRAMGFDTVCVAPPFAPGASGDIFITADHEALHPALDWQGSADAGIARMVDAAAAQGLRIWLDLALDRVAIDAAIHQREERWFSTGGCGALPNPRRTPYRLDVAYARLEQTEVAEAMTAWWLDRLGRLVRAGVAGFRCLEPDRVPPPLWRQIIDAIRTRAPQCRFLAWTPDVERAALPRLEGVGFDHVCSSLAWWDGRASWFVDEAEALRRIAPAIASPEPSFFERRAARLPPGSDIPTSCRLALRLAAASASGILVPMGFEYATRRPFDAARAGPEDFDRARDEAPADLSADVRAANALVERVAAHRVDGEMRALTGPLDPVTALLRADTPDVRAASRAVVVLVNPDLARSAPLDLALSPLPPQAGAAFATPEPLDAPDTEAPDTGAPDTGAPATDAPDMAASMASPMAPGEVRVLAYAPSAPVIRPAGARSVPDPLTVVATRIAIEALAPSVPYGNLAVKRLVGEAVAVSADIIADGHEVLAAELLWRADDEAGWHRAAMRLIGNDRWAASFCPERIGRHRFTVEAWWDLWGTFRHDLAAKHAAGQDVAVEVEEGRHMLQTVAARAPDRMSPGLLCIADRVKSGLPAEQIAILLSQAAADAMRAADERPFASRSAPEIPLDVDRPQAAFASWYEMFPRSATNDPARHGTFADVIGRMPAIRAMGFDVL